MKFIRNIFSRLFIPKYDELALFMMSLVFLLLFFTDAQMRSGFHSFFIEQLDPRIFLGIFLFGYGMLLSLYHVFIKRPKGEFEKFAMVFFAITINAISGIIAGIHMLREAHGLLLAFPIWNIADGILLMLLFRVGVIDENSIKEGNANLLQVIIGLTFVIAVFFVSAFVFQMYWAITFSICVAYTSQVHGMSESLLSTFFGRKFKNDAGDRILKY